MHKKSLGKSLWKYNRRSGYWDRQRDVDDESSEAWKNIFQKDEPNEHFHVSSKKPKHDPTKPLKEEGEGAPANNAGAGNIAGLTGEPGVSPKQQKKHKYRVLRRAPPQALQENCGCMRGKFAGEETFIVPSSVFFEARNARRKGKHWSKYLGESQIGQEIREYYRQYKGKKPIILQCERTGAMHYAHFGNKKNG